ncbi:amidohydrolase family protein [Nocardioides sp. LHG3406-4]|uniref:amidohydrolase family protein n=1 Tax=Nocardioides sp. LHG3406-4 TaxID=2804575 RepID=UPI003CF9B849
MIIDPHNHVLGTALPPGHERFIKEMRGAGMRTAGLLPSDRPATEEDWDKAGGGWEPVEPTRLLEDHRAVGVDVSVILSVAPSDYTEYGMRGSVDLTGATDVPGPPSIDRANDYIAALTRTYDSLLGMAAVNPRYRGVEAAKEELSRSVGELGLTGLKIYPMYDHYAVDDVELSMPVLEHAMALDIPVMVHMGLTPARDTVLAYGKPGGLDEVARRLPDLRILVCHAGFPWVDDTLSIVGRHENLYLDVSYFIRKVAQADIYGFLQRARQLDCPWSRICWASDYPGGGAPAEVLPKFALVNDAADGGMPVGRADMAHMLGGNWARFAGLSDWSAEETMAQVEEWEPRWRTAWSAAASEAPRPGEDDPGCCS